jgi:glycosyltransferase involved in cell wall biosynthesis
MANILIVLPNNLLGGAEQILKMIASYYEKDNVQVFFLQKKTDSAWDKLSTINLNFSFSNNKFLAIIGLVRFIIKNPIKKWDRLYSSHVNVTGLLGILIRLKLLSKVCFIARESTTIFKRFKGFKLFVYKQMYKFGYVKVNLLICQTEEMKQQLIVSLPQVEIKIKIKVIPNPFDLAVAEISCAELINIHDYGDYIVSAGRLIPEKGFDILIQSFNKIKIIHKDLILIILGNGKYKEQLMYLIKSLNLQKEVILLGFVDNVYPYFKNAKLCVVSSRIEGFPNVLLQMMSQNEKVVSTKCAGEIDVIPEVVIAETNDISSLEQAIIQCLSSDTSKNKSIFYNYLKERSIKNFVGTIEEYLINE